MRAVVLRFKILYLNAKKQQQQHTKKTPKQPIMVWLMTAGIMVAGDGRYNGG